MSGLLKLKTGSLRSDVWDHFEKGEKTAKCKHCDKELSFCGGTTNLRDHLLEIMENSIIRRKTTMLTSATGRSTNLY